MDPNWRFFGYNVDRLRQDMSGSGITQWVPSYPVSYSSYWNQGKPFDQQSSMPLLSPDAETPAPGDERAESLTIEQIYDQIMGEQPGTASDRATQWYNVESMLFYLQSELFRQTDSLEANWESPAAKDAYLRKVGETLAHVEVWREAAAANHQGLAMLAGAMRSAQTKMEELWQRYQRALQDATEGPLGDRQADLGRRDRVRASHKDSILGNSNKASNVRWRYDQEARELISETADSYATSISKLETARARRMTPMNAILHPEAAGIPIDVPPIGSGPPPPAMPGAFNTAPPGPPAGRPPAPTFNGAGQPTFADPRPAGNAPRPPAATPASPGIPPAFARGSVAIPPTPPGVSGPRPPGTGSAPAPNLAGLSARPAPPVSGLRAPGNTPPAAPGSNAPGTFTPRGNTGMPGTIMPPPGGGAPQRPNLKGKTLGRKEQNPAPGMGHPGSVPPPPAGAPPSRKDGRKSVRADNGAAPPSDDNAFRPPPPTAPSIVDTKRNTKKRARSEASAAEQLRTPSVREATPPVLSNARIETKAGGDARRKRPTRPAEPTQSEFTAEVPTGTVPVFEGRLAQPRRQPDQQPLGDVPIALRGPAYSGNNEQDRGKAPATQADRALRSTENTPSADAWDVANPGGPVVSSNKQEGYRAEPRALGT
ncbi:hypothetical protein BAY61_01075 [Prauserella marina]|uniref:Uncharacterized protein n=1 Tax=Prauserella marina TaxID=530584 RepID=A0A222VIQ8_9PSEU|nr:hypothetical protein [Prauserella marina]ASR33809.1 hypothetical protein BAY61_01075 [Prauserella marina]PWV82390.1 hypothetical protein DES30_102631 [Prauserella marina]SDC67996.1 hypothetical protein SAMN05421630_103167 [Prauserella marina]